MKATEMVPGKWYRLTGINSGDTMFGVSDRLVGRRVKLHSDDSSAIQVEGWEELLSNCEEFASETDDEGWTTFSYRDGGPDVEEIASPRIIHKAKSQDVEVGKRYKLIHSHYEAYRRNLTGMTFVPICCTSIGYVVDWESEPEIWNQESFEVGNEMFDLEPLDEAPAPDAYALAWHDYWEQVEDAGEQYSPEITMALKAAFQAGWEARGA